MKRAWTSKSGMSLRCSAMTRMAALGGLALAGWASAAEPGKATLLGESSQRVAIVNHEYERATLIVPTGTTVTWINKDEHVHSVVSTTQAFISPRLETDETYFYKFSLAPNTRLYGALLCHVAETRSTKGAAPKQWHSSDPICPAERSLSEGRN